MDYTNFSDLEEGEILEYESGSPSYSRCNDFLIKDCSFGSLRKDYNKSGSLRLEENQESDIYICEQEKDGYTDKTSQNKWGFNEKLGGMKSSVSVIDLESISSEEEHKSDEENKYSGENKKYMIYSKSRNGRKKHSSQFYGTVEDIMSEIGETICRKSRCNYKKRKSKESQHDLNRYSEKSYDFWSHKVFSSHLKSKKHKRNLSLSNSDSDTAKDRMEKRKKKKRKREICYENDKKVKKKSQVRDFDEMRRILLEKLKKQKEEEESKALNNDCSPEVENSEIQDVDMLIDCTNYVDNPSNAVPVDSPGEEKSAENEDELDLIQLRLIALASNKKQKCGETMSKSVKSEDFPEIKKSSNKSNEEVDLDRYELLLRAEALKTALLKKHQKRLNKSKAKIVENAKDGDLIVESVGYGRSEESNVSLDVDACKENLEKEIGNKETESLIQDLSPEIKIDEVNEASLDSNDLKKTHLRPKFKRKKKKSVSLANNLKENSDVSEAFEEDDRMLRSQLLSDLMKKKSLKNLKEKPVLLESIQTSANKPSPYIRNCQSPKVNGQPIPVVIGKTSRKKVNPPKVVKPVNAVAIPKAEIQRIIVHLGSEDSSEEDDSPSETPSTLEVEENQEEVKESKEAAVVKSENVNKSIQADYERSVELLLSQARKKIEGEKRNADENSTLATPEAVYKHLPLSQRLEYIRLKQKIAEREKLRKEKSDNSKTSTEETPNKIPQKSKHENNLKSAVKPVASFNNKLVNESLPKPAAVVTSSSNNTITGRFTSLNGLKVKEGSLRKIVNKTKNNVKGVNEKELFTGKELKSEIQRNRLLLPSSQALISKLKLLLRKIKIEKIIEENYEKEIIKLKNQLSLLEKKKSEQRFKIKKLGEESMKTYKAIQGITTTKSNDKTLPVENDREQKMKDGASGTKVEEKKTEEKMEETKTEAEGKKVLDEPEMELSKGLSAQTKTDERLNEENETSEKTKETSIGVCLTEYQSPLQVFNKVSFREEKVDPNLMMCQFDLTGVCKDEDCAYQHLRAS